MFKLIFASALLAVAFAAEYGHHGGHAYSSQNQVNIVKGSVPVEIKYSHEGPSYSHAPVVSHVPVVQHVPVVHHVPIVHHAPSYKLSYHH